jgi:hypothetical protein
MDQESHQKPLDYQDSCLRDSTCPTQLKKFHYKQFTVSRFLPQRVDLPPAQEILLQKVCVKILASAQEIEEE